MQKESYLEKWGISVYGALEKIITASGISEDQDIYVVNHVQTPFQAYHSQDSAIKAIISALLPKKYLDRVRSEKVNPEKPIETLALIHYEDELRTLWDYQGADEHNSEKVIHTTLYHLIQDQRRKFDEAMMQEVQRILIENPSNIVPLRRM